MDSAIRNTINKVLAHEAPVVFGTVAEDLEPSLSELKSFGDPAVAHVRSAILSCASEQRGGPRWWLGAAELCKALAAIGTPQASRALLDVLEANSRVFEFDGVRASAARCLGTFNDKGLVTRLVAASKLSNAPVLAIKEAIDKLGGEPLQSPEVIIEEGRSMEPEEAIRFFEIHQQAVDGWPKENQASFYYVFGLKKERLHGEIEGGVSMPGADDGSEDQSATELAAGTHGGGSVGACAACHLPATKLRPYRFVVALRLGATLSGETTTTTYEGPFLGRTLMFCRACITKTRRSRMGLGWGAVAVVVTVAAVVASRAVGETSDGGTMLGYIAAIAFLGFLRFLLSVVWWLYVPEKRLNDLFSTQIQAEAIRLAPLFNLGDITRWREDDFRKSFPDLKLGAQAQGWIEAGRRRLKPEDLRAEDIRAEDIAWWFEDDFREGFPNKKITRVASSAVIDDSANPEHHQQGVDT